MEDLIVQGFSEGIAAFLSGVGLVFALLNCFFGYKLRKIWITLVGILVGFLIGFAVVMFLSTNLIASLIIGVITGILLGIISFKLYLVGIFLLCGASAFFLVYSCIPVDWLRILLGFIAGIAVGILAVKFVRPVTILSTGINGGFTAGQAIFSAFQITSWQYFPIGAILAVLGILVQFKTTKK